MANGQKVTYFITQGVDRQYLLPGCFLWLHSEWGQRILPFASSLARENMRNMSLVIFGLLLGMVSAQSKARGVKV